MKLDRLDRRVLRFVSTQYPIPHNRETTKEVVAIGERPLPAEGEIVAYFSGQPPDQVKKSVEKLISYQCVAKVYLHSPSDFRTVQLAAGRQERMPVATAGNGHYGYQVTKFGMETIDGFLGQRLKRFAMKWCSKIVEEPVRLIVALLVGMLLAACLGLDLRSLRR